MTNQEQDKQVYSFLVQTLPNTFSIAYGHFESKVSAPFCLYRNTNPNIFNADDKVFYKKNAYIIDLCTEKKDSATETLLENAFDSNNIPYDKDESFISDERIYEVRYYI